MVALRSDTRSRDDDGLIRERRVPFVKVGRLVRLRRTDIDDYLAGRLVPAVRR